MKFRNIYVLFLILLCGGSVKARPVADSVQVYFRHGYSTLDLSLHDNRRTLDELVERLQALSSDTTKKLLSVSIEGNASPDGLHGANLRLSRKRAQNVLTYIRTRTAIPDSLITVRADGVDWRTLAAMVETAPFVPAREEVLDILRNIPLWIYDGQGRIVDGRKKRLMDLKGGAAYRFLKERFFPQLRNSRIGVVCTVDSLPQEKLPPVVPAVSPAVAFARKPVPASGPLPGSVPAASGPEAEEREPLQRLALKTNLLYDAILMPSLEVEYRIDDRWSVNLEGEVAWWSENSKHKYYQIATISPEARYWFGTKKPWHGHYIGAFAGGSWYDLENGGRGYQGEAVMAGLSYGYMFPIGRRLSLEAGIGIGYLHTEYEEYLPVDGHYVYQQTSRTNYFGPVKLKFALVWRPWNVNKKGGAR